MKVKYSPAAAERIKTTGFYIIVQIPSFNSGDRDDYKETTQYEALKCIQASNDSDSGFQGLESRIDDRPKWGSPYSTGSSCIT